MKIESGEFYQMSNEEYHRGLGKDWESRSGLAHILESPRKYKWGKEHPEDLDVFDKKAEKYHFGTAVHTYFLEPENFDNDIYIMLDERRSKATTEAVRASGKAPIKQAVYDSIEEMSKALNSGFYEKAREAITAQDNFIEMSGFMIDPETGIKLKTRPDWISSDQVIWDLKKHGGMKSFKNTAMDLHYDLQAAIALKVVSFCTGVQHTQIGYVVVEDAPPHEWSVWIANEAYIASGREKLTRALELLFVCLRTDIWPGVEDEYQLLTPPIWRINQMDGGL